MARRRSVPATPPLVDPATGRRVLRRPDLRGLWNVNPSGAPLTTDEVDFDEVIIHRSWRSFAQDKPGEVKYFFIEFSQRNPGGEWVSAVKALRFLRLTRVPRYLRQAGANGTAIAFSQQQDLLAALRERGVLFVNMIAKSSDLPLIFAYGVQAVGATIEEAAEKADLAFEVLKAQLDGTYQQLQYQPLTMVEAERLARYQTEWNKVAAARGRPMPQGASMGASGLLDGNRTDAEQANQQLETFVRGMANRSFVLTLITVPLSPQEISVAWRNITQRLSEVRSEQSGTRSVNAGMALPLSLTAGDATSTGDTHTRGVTASTGTTDTVSASMAHAISSSVADSRTDTTSASHSTSLADTQGVTDTTGTNHSVTTGTATTTGTTQTSSVTDTTGTNSSVANSTSVAEGTNRSIAEGTNRSVAVSDQTTSTQQSSTSQTDGSSFGGGLVVNGNQNTSTATGSTVGTSTASGTTATSGTSTTATSGSSTTTTTGTTVTDGVSASRAIGSSTATSLSSTTSSSVTDGVSASTALSRATTATTGDTTGTSVGLGRTNTSGVSDTATQGTSNAVSRGQAFNDAVAVAATRTSNTGGGLGVVPSFGVSVSRNTENVGKRILGDVLEAQMRRYLEGVESGAFLYQMFLQTPDEATLEAGAGLLKSAFWGAKASDASARLPQPFHVVTDLAADEAERIRAHAQLFTSYRKREQRVELIEPFAYSTFVTPSELATFSHPPTTESIGLLAVHDSMPVLAMPSDRDTRDVHLGHIVNGERAAVSDQGFGIDLTEMLSHMLITGVSGSGKTTTLQRMLYELTRVRRRVVLPPTPENPAPTERLVAPGILAIDWMRNVRNLIQVVEPERFRFYSVSKPELGAFRWNPLAVPDDAMDPADWLSTQADNFVAAWNLGEFGRALVSELLDDLYRANRLADHVLRPEVRDNMGVIVADAVVLPALDRTTLPAGAIVVGADGIEVANVYTCPALSRTVGMTHLAVAVMAKVEEAATPEGARLYGTSMRDRIQSLYRRVQYFLPGSKLAEMLTFDDSVNDRHCLTVGDLINPEVGYVTVLETDGLDMASRRLVIGSVVLAVYRLGLHFGEGTYDNFGDGPGTFVVLEESHELLGEKGQDEDQASASTRIALFSSFMRRARALGLRAVVVAQNPGDLDESITSNTSTVLVHRCYADNDRKRVFSLLNWNNQIGQQQREWRYLGELPVGYCIARLDARTSWLESAPVQFLTDPAPFGKLTDPELAPWVARLPRH